jgi:hypothetical protein
VVAGGVGVQVVAGVVGGVQRVGVGRVGERGVEVDDAVGDVLRADPVVDLVALGDRGR